MRFNVLDLLLPKETKFFDYMNRHVGHLIEGCKVFNDLVRNIECLSEDEIKRKLVAIKDCETKGDETELRLLDELNLTFITPLDREDIHTLAINVDRALDILNSISRKIEIYNIRKVPANVCRFSSIILAIAEEAAALIKLLEEKKNLRQRVARMHALELEADELFHISMAELFDDNNHPIFIIKFKEVYEHLESVVDAIDYVGKVVRGIDVKQG